MVMVIARKIKRMMTKAMMRFLVITLPKVMTLIVVTRTMATFLIIMAT